MVDKPTRSKGLAENSGLPAKLGVLMASVAENLELHMKGLDLKDNDAKKEYNAYAKLAREHRNISASLQAIAGEMEAYRDLAMGKHNAEVLSDPKILAAFGKFMKAERDLIAWLQERMRRNSKIPAAKREKSTIRKALLVFAVVVLATGATLAQQPPRAPEFKPAIIEQPNIPSVFIVDKGGVLRFKYIGQNTVDRPSYDCLFNALDVINGMN